MRRGASKLILIVVTGLGVVVTGLGVWSATNYYKALHQSHPPEVLTDAESSAIFKSFGLPLETAASRVRLIVTGDESGYIIYLRADGELNRLQAFVPDTPEAPTVLPTEDPYEPPSWWAIRQSHPFREYASKDAQSQDLYLTLCRSGGTAASLYAVIKTQSDRLPRSLINRMTRSQGRISKSVIPNGDLDVEFTWTANENRDVSGFPAK